MRISFTPDGWRDYIYRAATDRKTLAAVNRLVEDVRRDAFAGLGKPEPLKADLAGWWSRRVTGAHRLVYRVEGRGEERPIIIAQCRHHY